MEGSVSKAPLLVHWPEGRHILAASRLSGFKTGRTNNI